MGSERQAAATSGELPPPETAETAGTAGGTMKAIVQDGYGSVSVLRSARIARPAISGREVLLRVHAAGLDRGTWHLMAGRPYLVRLAGGRSEERRVGEERSARG